MDHTHCVFRDNYMARWTPQPRYGSWNRDPLVSLLEGAQRPQHLQHLLNHPMLWFPTLTSLAALQHPWKPVSSPGPNWTTPASPPPLCHRPSRPQQMSDSAYRQTLAPCVDLPLPHHPRRSSHKLSLMPLPSLHSNHCIPVPGGS